VSPSDNRINFLQNIETGGVWRPVFRFPTEQISSFGTLLENSFVTFHLSVRLVIKLQTNIFMCDFSFSLRRVWRWLLHRVVWLKFADISEVFAASIIRAIRPDDGGIWNLQFIGTGIFGAADHNSRSKSCGMRHRRWLRVWHARFTRC
jgi:hypothetical protein